MEDNHDRWEGPTERKLAHSKAQWARGAASGARGNASHVTVPINNRQQPASRQLNMNDLAEAHTLPRDERVRLMQGILADLRNIDAPTSRDAAGIARRGSLVFREHLEGRSIKELAAAYIELRLLGAQIGVIDAIETTCGVPDVEAANAPPHDAQSEHERAFREQLKRQSCPGCGDDGLPF